MTLPDDAKLKYGTRVTSGTSKQTLMRDRLLKQKSTVIFIHFAFLNRKWQFSRPRASGPEKLAVFLV